MSTPRQRLGMAALLLALGCANEPRHARSEAKPTQTQLSSSSRELARPVPEVAGLEASQAPSTSTTPGVSASAPEPARRPLLVVLHGLGGSGESLLQSAGFSDFVRSQGLVVLAPDGSQDSHGRRFWNAHPACCNFERREIDDVARLQELTSAALRRPDVDPERVYVVGYSNGGFMALRLACAMSEQLAAVVSIAGAGPQPGLDCPIVGPLGVLLIHGDEDPVVRYEGGSVFDMQEQPRHAAAPETLAQWAGLLGCARASEAPTRLDLWDSPGGAETVVQRHRSCARGAVELWTVEGGGHYLPITRGFAAHIYGFLLQHTKARRTD